MKKLRNVSAFLLCVAMAFTMFAMQSFAAAPVLCDANSDSAVNAKDVLRLKQHLAQWKVEIDLNCADCNRDSVVNAKDLLIIRQALADIIPIPTFAEATTAGTTATMPTGLPQGVPGDYPNELNGITAINQIGYQTNSTKIANFRFADDYTEKTLTAYVYSLSEGRVVKECVSSRRSFYDTMQHYTGSIDFSDVTTPGSYRIYTPFGYSYDFVISENPYKKLEDAMVTALYYNRCGCALDEKIVGKDYVHDVCHSGDKRVTFINLFDADSGIYGPSSVYGKASDYTGGLHDAGDYGRYVQPGTNVVADLIYAAKLFPNATNCNIITDNASENIPDVLDEARYEAKWLLKMQDKATGGVYNRLCTKAFANYFDMPDFDAQYGNGLWMSRVSVRTTSAAAAAYAACYGAFKNIDIAFANECLTAAKSALKYVDEHYDERNNYVTNTSEGVTMVAGNYDNSAVDPDLWWAYNALHAGTGEQVYKDKVAQLVAGKAEKTRDFTYAGGVGMYGSIEILANPNADATLKAEVLAYISNVAAGYAKECNRDKYGSIVSPGAYYWGSNGQAATKMKALVVTDYFGNTSSYDKQLRGVISYILGTNSYSKCWVTGFGTDSPQNPHHRPSMVVKQRGGENAPGWVVAGINGINYVDSMNSYDTNEVAIYWNSGPVFGFASVIERDMK